MSTQEQWRLDYDAVAAERAADSPPHPANYATDAEFYAAGERFDARSADRQARSEAATAAGRAALNE